MLKTLWSRIAKPALVLTRDDGQVYLTRWHLLTSKWLTIYLHKLTAPDPDREPHNHPWDAIVLVLRGAYWQARYGNDGSWQSGECIEFVNRLGAYYHRITNLLAPRVWTLVIAGPRKREWGFAVDGKHMDWRVYVDTIQSKVMAAKGIVSGERVES